jgi:hypothetical protein
VWSPSTFEYEIGPYSCAQAVARLQQPPPKKKKKKSAYPNMALGELEGIAVVVDRLAHVRDAPRPFDERRETREEQAM